MLGFELSIKGETISTALNCGVVALAAVQTNENQVISFDLIIHGLDTSDLQEAYSITWYEANLQEGDEFTVRVKEISENSDPLQRKRQLSEDESKLQAYYVLKEKLESEGMLQNRNERQLKITVNETSMLGFELIVNGEAKTGTVKDGVMSIIATQNSSRRKNSIDLHFGGLDRIHSKNGENIHWCNCDLREGDEFTVRVKEITQTSVPQRTGIVPFNMEDSLNKYYRLKEELEKKGLI